MCTIFSATRIPKAKSLPRRKSLTGTPSNSIRTIPATTTASAQALLSQDKYAPALEEYKKLSELEPGTSENYLRMAQLYRRLGKFDESESSLLRAKQLSPGSLEVLYNEALLYEDQGRYDDAVKVLTDAIAGMKNQSGTESNPSALAILYEQLGPRLPRAGKISGSGCHIRRNGQAKPRSA